MNLYDIQVNYSVITWDRVKKFLYDRKRVDELCNKNTGREVLTTWNGLMIMQWDSSDWVNTLYRSGRPSKFVDHKGNVIRTEPAPGSKPKIKQLKLF